jgi:hypothetical protein
MATKRYVTTRSITSKRGVIDVGEETSVRDFPSSEVWEKFLKKGWVTEGPEDTGAADTGAAPTDAGTATGDSPAKGKGGKG